MGSQRTIKVLNLDNQQIATVPGSSGKYSVRWSPNRRFLVAFDVHDGGINVFDFQTQKWSKLQPAPPDASFDFPTFSSNSQFVYFVREGIDPGVYRVPVSGGPAQFIADMTGFHHAGVVRLWFGLDPEDSPMLLRDAGSDEIYSLTLKQR
jgi:WD40 repeat protein